MGTNCIQNCKRILTKENNEEIKSDNIITKNLEKKVRFNDIDATKNSHGKTSLSTSFGLFDNNNKKKKVWFRFRFRFKPSPLSG